MSGSAVAVVGVAACRRLVSINRSCALCSVRRLSKSSLVASFNNAVAGQANDPSAGVDTVNVGLFGNTLLVSPSGFRQLNQQIRAKTAALEAEILTPADKRPSKRTTVQLFDDLSNQICVAADLTECVRNVHPDESYVEAAEYSTCEFNKLVESLNTTTELYNTLDESSRTEADRLDDVDKRVTSLFLNDMMQSGVQLPDKEIFEAGSKFCRGADRPVGVSYTDRKIYGVHERYLNGPMHNAVDASTRAWAHRTYFQYSAEQEKNLLRLVRSRHDLAKLTGFRSYSERAQTHSLLGSEAEATKFLVGTIQTLKSQAELEVQILQDLLGQCGERSALGEWDISYLCSLYRKLVFVDNGSSQGVEDDSPLPYLSLGAAMEGFNRLINLMYDAHLESVRPAPGEVWDEHVKKLVRCYKELAGGDVQTPIVVLSLSLPSVRNAFLTPSQVETLFHEMGHAMHSMLGRTKYQHVAGTRCSTDMAEVPSNLMEYFFYDPRVFRELVTRSEDGSRMMPVEQAAMIIAARSALSALETVQQAAYSLFDLTLHGSAAEDILAGRLTGQQLLYSILQNALPNVARNPRTAWHHRFSHLVPYGAKYYSYLVAKSTASLIWNSKFKQDPFNREAGEQWAHVQSLGGERPSAELLSMMLGFTPTAENLVYALQQEAIDSSSTLNQVKL